MSHPIARSAAALIVVVAGVLAGADVVLRALPREHPSALDRTSPLSLAVVALVYAVVGAYVAWRRPEHPIGWILAAPLLLISGGGVLTDYAEYGLVASAGALPRAELVQQIALIASGGWVVLLVPVTFGLLLFPSGKLPSPRWRPAAWLAGIAIAGQAVVTTAVVLFPGAVPDALQAGAAFVMVAAILLSAWSTVVRFRRARGRERQQLKWIVAAAVLLAGTFSVVGLLSKLGPELPHAKDPDAAGNLVFSLVWSFIPIAVAVAILRHRLYDIDVLINRTLVYAAVTATLGATFFSGLVVLQTLLRPLTSGSDLAVAASTLVSFALFQPVRRRVQDAVDRRFNRSRYDAARTLEAFADRLRDEVNLDALRADLVGAVYETMAPTTMSLWLRERPA